MKLHAIVPLIVLSAILTANAQVPVTVNRSTIITGGSVSLPSGSGGGSLNAGVAGTLYLQSTWVASTSTNITSTTGSCSAAPTSGPDGTYVSVTFYPTVIFTTNLVGVTTNWVSGYALYKRWPNEPYQATIGASQSYIVTVVEDGQGGGGSITQTGTLSGSGDTLESISRKNTSTDYRKLLGFQVKASTNAVANSLAVVLANTTTNTPPCNNFLGLQLYRDADGGGEWDGGDTLLATTTNAAGFAIFADLNVPITTTNQAFFIAASFCPTNQTRNSFLSASLKGQNIILTMAGTNTVMETTGGTVIGKQYAFLDTTVEEDAAGEAALANQIDAAVTGATNALNSAWSQQLATATNGWSRTGGNSSSKTSLTDTILPAAAAGAAGIGAALTSDQLTNQPLSNEYTKPK